MSLAHNIHGEPFSVPSTAVAWRVKRMRKGVGAPEVVYGDGGLPLTIPIDADIDALTAFVDVPGRYRLDPVDEEGQTLKGTEDKPLTGYVYVHKTTAPEAGPGPLPPTPRGVTNETIVIEAVRMNTELARTVVDRFPAMLEAAATLVRAADGAGLPARPGMARELDAEGEAPAPQPDRVSALIEQCAPMLLSMLMGAGKKLPSLAELFDWRKAAAAGGHGPKPTEAPAPDETVAAPTAAPTAAPSAAPTAAPTSPGAAPSPSMLAHFLEVRALLTPEESALATATAMELDAAARRAWMDELAALSVPEAVERVRRAIGTAGHRPADEPTGGNHAAEAGP